ncbi:MAG: GAF domain-containing protein [Candidatus Kapabacteria bacterium]|nr:GAF domain-containing protein [Candidatus Kapabacteria bacterium]
MNTIDENKDFVEQIKSLTYGEPDFIANSSNFVAWFFNAFRAINWVGFYLLSGDELILGPFQGKPACIRIELGRGVCGTAALEKKAIIVDNVHEFPGHIACDYASNSEIVIPMIVDDVLYGVLDIDSPEFSRFDENDLELYQILLNVLLDNSDMSKIAKYYNE